MAARRRMLLSIALAALSAVALAACGGDEDVGEIPADVSARMLAAIEDARTAQEATPPECETIADAASTVSNEASRLPESPVRGAVTEAAENLHDLARSDQCQPSTTGRQGPRDGGDDTTTTTTPTAPTTTTTQTTTTAPEGGGGGNGANQGNGGNQGNGVGPPPQAQPPGEGGGGLGGGDTGGQPPPDTGGTGGGTGSD